MTPSHSAPCCTSACGLGLPIRPFGHMYPLATCLACLQVSKSSLLPTRNFLSMAVSLYCSELSTLLSQDPPLPPIPHITCYGLPYSVSSHYQGQGRGLPVPEWQSPLAPSFVTPKTSATPGCLSLSVFLPAVLHILSLPVYSKGAAWPDIGYHPASYQLHSHIWGHNFFLTQGNFRLPLSTISSCGTLPFPCQNRRDRKTHVYFGLLVLGSLGYHPPLGMEKQP